MRIILAVVGSPLYREGVLGLADQLAELLDGKVRVATLGSPPEEGPLPERREGPAIAREAVWIGPDPIRGVVRELAQCDIGVVGRTLAAEAEPGGAIGSDVRRLKQLVTKPLVIVPETVRSIRNVLFVYTEHPESGHALSLAEPLSNKGVAIKLVSVIHPLGRTELSGTGAEYLKAHNVPHETVEAECENCTAEGGPVAEILHLVKQEDIDVVVMGGTRRGLVGRLLWPEMAREVVWNADVPVLVWY